MKKFVLRVLLYCVLIAAPVVCICMVIDPFNVMHPLHIRDNGAEPNKNYIKMTYVLKNPERFDSFLFGSSRVGSLHVENIPGGRCYNLTYSEGLPEEHLNNIMTLLSANIIPRKIYIGVDSLSYTLDPASHYTQQLRCPYEYLKAKPLEFLKLYLDPAVTVEAAFEVIKGHDPTNGYEDIFYQYGWDFDYNHQSAFDPDTVFPVLGPTMRLSETLSSISEIASLCKDNGIELVVFTNPMYAVTYEASLEHEYLLFLQQLAGITPFYNFSGYNMITTNIENYYDSSHYSVEVSDLMIDCMCNGECSEELYAEGFGMYVTEENLDAFLLLMESQSARQDT